MVAFRYLNELAGKGFEKRFGLVWDQIMVFLHALGFDFVNFAF